MKSATQKKYYPLVDLLTACSQSPVLCLNPYPVKYQPYALQTMIAQNQQTLSSKGDFATYFPFWYAHSPQYVGTMFIAKN